MSFSIRAGDARLTDALRRIAGEQISAALSEGRAEGTERAERIHRVRKRCKKLRGLLRLVRPGLDAYSVENAAIRDIARRLSGSRDAAALVETCDRLSARFEEALAPDGLAPVREALAARARDAEAAPGAEDALARAMAELDALRARSAGWRVTDEDALWGGLGHSYRRARKAMRIAREAPGGETLHDWRKRVKDHGTHARLLRRVEPDLMAPHRKRVAELADMLGEHHDLDVLDRALPGLMADVAPERLEAVRALARQHEKTLAARAFALGRCLLTEKPGPLVRRWSAVWAVWREDRTMP